MEKIFTDVSYVVCFKQITKYVIDYNLELLSVDLQKKKIGNATYYEAKIKYGLGLER